MMENSRREQSDVPVGTTIAITAGGVAIVYAILGFLWLAYGGRLMSNAETAAKLQQETMRASSFLPESAPPRHEPPAGYAWTNQQHTLLQIPIERAMELIVEKQTPPFTGAAEIGR